MTLPLSAQIEAVQVEAARAVDYAAATDGMTIGPDAARHRDALLAAIATLQGRPALTPRDLAIDIERMKHPLRVVPPPDFSTCEVDL